jgi:hypothetical protein
MMRRLQRIFQNLFDECLNLRNLSHLWSNSKVLPLQLRISGSTAPPVILMLAFQGMMRAGLPRWVVCGGVLRRRTAPAPTRVFSPRVRPWMRVAPVPMWQWGPVVMVPERVAPGAMWLWGPMWQS